jgi:hypothetical protein
VESQEPRLKACFPNSTDQILNAVEIESTMANMVIKSHYASLPFSSKPTTYWDANFVEDYIKWCMMLGIRHVPDDLALILDVKSTLLEQYHYMNEESVKTAIKINISKGKPDMVDAYGQINRIYLCQILDNYEKKLRQDHKRAIEIRDKLKAPPPEPTEAESDELMKVGIQDIYHRYIVDLKNDIEYISPNIYDFLVKMKINVVADSEKERMMTLAKNYLNDLKLEYDKCELVLIAKRFSVREYFNAQILNKVEILF